MLHVDIRKTLGAFHLEARFDAENEVLALLGASGCGKSVTLKCIAGILTPDEGQITLDGIPLFDSAAKIDLPPQRRQVGYLFQQYALFPNMTVRQNIAVAVREKSRRTAAVSELLRRMELEAVAELRPHQLSGGQQQRCALARILASEPRAILLDEPFSALDTITKSAIHRWYLDVMEQIHLSTLFITHDIDEAILLSDRIYILSGRPGHITDEIHINVPKPRAGDFTLTPEFLAYKRQIIEAMHLS